MSTGTGKSTRKGTSTSTSARKAGTSAGGTDAVPQDAEAAKREQEAERDEVGEHATEEPARTDAEPLAVAAPEVPPEQVTSVPDKIVANSQAVPADQASPPDVAAEVEAAMASGAVPPPLVAPNAPSAPPVPAPTDDPPGEGKWVLYNCTMGPIVYDDAGHQVGGNDRVLVDVVPNDSPAARAIARGDLIKSKAAKDPHISTSG